MKAVLFSNEIGDSNQIRRIRSLVSAGVDLVVFSVHRRLTVNEINVPIKERYLFTTGDSRHLSRFFKLMGALVKLIYYKNEFRGVTFLIGRNIDMLSLVFFAYKFIVKKNTIVVYECLDIHQAFTDKGLKSKAIRAAERLLLGSVDIILTSSPYYITNFFAKVQSYDKEYFLVENKLYFYDQDPPRRPRAETFFHTEKLRIGFVGKFKCQVSFELFLKLAEEYADIFEMHIYGYIPDAIKDAGRIKRYSNIKDFGRYKYPDDLERVYGSLDAVWVADLWRPGANSDWALANRLYEASYFGCPSISVRGLATADFILEKGIGYVVDDARPETVGRLLRELHANGTREMRRSILQHDARDFVQTGDDIRRFLAVVERVHAAKSARK